MKLFRLIILALIIFILVNIVSLLKANAAVRIKDIAKISQSGDIDLIGYGLVVGLAGTGDGKGTQFTVQSVVNMLQRMGLTVPLDKVKVKNVAAVMVTTKLPHNAAVGSTIDVTVSSIGDASTLEGGTLLMTPLSDRNGTLYAYAQGPMSIGGFNVQVGDNKIVNNYTLVGRIPNGAKVEHEPPGNQYESGSLKLSLFNPDFTTIERIKQTVNQKYPLCATSVDDASLNLTIPKPLGSSDGAVQFIASIENLEVVPDTRARVVINERTGTIVAGGNVTIAPIAIAHGNITVEIKTFPVISQPEPFSQGKTVETTDSYLQVSQDQARVAYLEERSTISDIASALNAIGATPRDIIAIFQAMKQAGALRAELVIL